MGILKPLPAGTTTKDDAKLIDEVVTDSIIARNKAVAIPAKKSSSGLPATPVAPLLHSSDEAPRHVSSCS